ncbi:hypothetical protein R3W88_010807 [Solanum pinnatisectum]|uniref:PB1-like domain-containing protein n=1 Tax=Solanum pinnatisectum TaxID=50273 RepID=A0AAV9L708_9SOLN|nr:hypothetical protein R3W88_010807 [Solanum pinnatisectum]
MSGFTLVTLRWYHGGVLDLSSGQPIYKGGQVTEFLDVDMDKMFYFEFRGYIKELGYTTTCTFSIKPSDNGILEDIDNDMNVLDLYCSLEDGDIVEIYESGSTFNKGAKPNCGPNIVVGDETLSGEDPFTITPQTTTVSAARASSTSTPINTTNTTTTNPATTDPASTDPDPDTATTNPVGVDPTIVDPNNIDVGPVGSDLVKGDGSDYSTEVSVDTECELVRDDDKDYGSDVHEEVRELRAKKRTF